MRELKIEHTHPENPQPPDCPSDNSVRRAARKGQSWYRYHCLHCGFDPKHPQGKYGAYLKPSDARAGKIFYPPYKDRILDAINMRYPDKDDFNLSPLFANLLRSEHIPWNIFIPMHDNLSAAAKTFDEIIGNGSIAEVLDILIEYAPEKQFALNDGTSFDTFVIYRHTDGTLGGIGIEIKYTESGYPLKRESKEYNDIMRGDNKKYADITRNCGFYRSDIATTPLMHSPLVRNEFRQIWRNHILGASMLGNGSIKYNLKHFFSITIYPQANTHFFKCIPLYEKMLTDYGKSTFKGITYEEFFDIMDKHFVSKEEKQWINYLIIRYLAVWGIEEKRTTP